ncbi:MAG: hypothetical protein GX452_13765 [Ignavibacteriales bacterium]|nr:hypothetical protein [Ignavibacteriales bacterium]
MIDDIITLLKAANKRWGKRVFRDYPDNFTTLPVVAVSLLAMPDVSSGDDRGQEFFEKTISIDIWTKDGVEDLMENLQDVMYGYSNTVYQTTAREFKEGDLYHLSIEYKLYGGN